MRTCSNCGGKGHNSRSCVSTLAAQRYVAEEADPRIVEIASLRERVDAHRREYEEYRRVRDVVDQRMVDVRASIQVLEQRISTLRLGGAS